MALTSNQLKNTRVLGEKFNKAYCREKLNELSKKSFEAQSPTTLRAYLHEASDTVLGNCDDSSSWSKWKEWKDSSMATNDVATHAASEDGRAVPEVEAMGLIIKEMSAKIDTLSAEIENLKNSLTDRITTEFDNWHNDTSEHV